MQQFFLEINVISKSLEIYSSTLNLKLNALTWNFMKNRTEETCIDVFTLSYKLENLLDSMENVLPFLWQKVTFLE